ncbi:MAG: hypothetical protein NTW73_03065 [Candidatus Parcubacteria bacterium]|nr:hypothetical protein [Candidatus Parcubacteria bacterium]
MDIKKLHYITENQSKFVNAQTFFTPHGITLIQTKLDTYEIQNSDFIVIAQSKVKQAWEQLKEPLFINDACWIIPSLNGFPGPYMKYINKWFTPQDFINLMRGKTDRTIILRDTIVYIDEQGSQTFTNNHHGIILENIYPGEYKNPSDVVVSLSKSGKSLAEELANKNFFLEGEDIVWNNFIDWLLKNRI